VTLLHHNGFTPAPKDWTRA